MVRSGFNPHPAQRQGATTLPWWSTGSGRCFNPHPAQRQGATLLCSCSPPTSYAVSILTLLSDRVRRMSTTCMSISPLVSILTLLSDRVRRLYRSINTEVDVQFQSSPCSATGCDEGRRRPSAGLQSFNPHPAQRQGATRRVLRGARSLRVSILTLLSDRVRHPHLKPLIVAYLVSILTLLSDRVRRSGRLRAGRARLVSILTLLSDRVRPALSVQLCGKLCSFNPHPAQRQGATRNADDLRSFG